MRLIDADALKEELKSESYLTYTHEYGDAIPVGWVMSAIDNAPTVSQNEWIPVSERLPEIDEEVIITDIEVSNTYQSRYIGNGYWECDNGTYKNRVIAWKPFPEPYEKRKGDVE